jgi:hypothetical protein
VTSLALYDLIPCVDYELLLRFSGVKLLFPLEIVELEVFAPNAAVGFRDV